MTTAGLAAWRVSALLGSLGKHLAHSQKKVRFNSLKFKYRVGRAGALGTFRKATPSDESEDEAVAVPRAALHDAQFAHSFSHSINVFFTPWKCPAVSQVWGQSGEQGCPRGRLHSGGREGDARAWAGAQVSGHHGAQEAPSPARLVPDGGRQLSLVLRASALTRLKAGSDRKAASKEATLEGRPMGKGVPLHVQPPWPSGDLRTGAWLPGGSWVCSASEQVPPCLLSLEGV